MSDKITLELTRDDIFTLGMAMSEYIDYWMNAKQEAIDRGDNQTAEIRQYIIKKGFELWERIQLKP